MKKAKQITALVAIILLVGLYIATFITSFFAGGSMNQAFMLCLILTVTIPLLAFVIILFIGRASDKKVIGDPEKLEVTVPEETNQQETDSINSNPIDTDSIKSDPDDSDNK